MTGTGAVGHPTQPVACRTAGSPPLPAREPVILQEVLVAAARHLDGSRRATGSRASASPAPDRWTYGRRGDAWTAQAVPRQQPTAAARQLRGRYRGWPVSSVGPVAILPRDQGRPLSSVHRRRPRLCAASKRACERLPRQHETAAACSVSATNRQGGRVGLVYMDHAPPVWGCPGPAARPTSACSAEQRARPATAAAAATVFFAKRRPPAAPCRVLDPADGLTRQN